MNIFQILPKKIFIETDKDGQDNRLIKENCQIYGSNNNSTSKIREYVVRPLDTIESIASKLEISTSLLKSKLKNNHLFIGQKIEF